jgi:hypothetical protein
MYFSFSFSSKLTLVINLSHICNYKPFYVTTSRSYQVPRRTIASIVTKMVDLDISCKCMGWNRHDSLY